MNTILYGHTINAICNIYRLAAEPNRTCQLTTTMETKSKVKKQSLTSLYTILYEHTINAICNIYSLAAEPNRTCQHKTPMKTNQR